MLLPCVKTEENPGKLDGKVAIITGATSGMGRDTAYLFVEEEAKVIITGMKKMSPLKRI